MRILLGKAERSTARFLARALREDAYAVDLASTAPAVLEECEGIEYAAIILHSDLPSCGEAADCFALLRQLRIRRVHTPALLILASQRPGQASIAAAASADPLTGGADAVLHEPFALSEMRLRLRRLIRLGAPITARSAWGGLALDPQTRCARRGPVEVHLTRREYALLELLLLRAPGTVTHADIVAHVWDGADGRDSNLIEVYMARLRRRLDQATGVKLLHTVRGVGYRVGPVES